MHETSFLKVVNPNTTLQNAATAITKWVAQLGYTVSVTSVYTGKYRSEDKLEIQMMHKLNTT